MPSSFLSFLKKRKSRIRRDLMWSSKRNCEKTKRRCLRNWYVKLTVVFMMPTPCVSFREVPPERKIKILRKEKIVL